MGPFVPLFANAHLATIAAHFWPAGIGDRRFPVRRRLYRTEPDVQVAVLSQRPDEAKGDLLLVHGLEGSAESSYMKSMAKCALEAGFAAHRFNLRTCGGTEALCPTLYHSGLTGDLAFVARELAAGGGPVFLVGFSLGGNLALKLAGELGEAARGVIAGVCAVSTPIDLAASTTRIEQRSNRIYETRFLRKLRRRMRAKARLFPERFPLDGLDSVRSIREFDDRFTAPAFGFQNAAHYYESQSAIRFLGGIRVPALLVQAKDDPVVPFGIFERPEVRANPCIELVAPEHGGHIGFLARRRPRFWADAAIIEWILEVNRR